MAKKKNKLDVNVVWGLARISLGLTFLWAFIDKLFGLGFSTCRDDAGQVAIMCEKAVIYGGSATDGFLKFATTGPFASIYQSLAGNELISWLFMIGLLGIGTALTLGIAMRLAVTSGVLLLMMMWSAALPPEHHPFIDDHVIYSIVLVGLLLVNKNQALGFGDQWEKSSIVKALPVLR